VLWLFIIILAAFTKCELPIRNHKDCL